MLFHTSIPAHCRMLYSVYHTQCANLLSAIALHRALASHLLCTACVATHVMCGYFITTFKQPSDTIFHITKLLYTYGIHPYSIYRIRHVHITKQVCPSMSSLESLHKQHPPQSHTQLPHTYGDNCQTHAPWTPAPDGQPHGCHMNSTYKSYLQISIV